MITRCNERKKKRCGANHDTFRGRGRHGQRHIAVFRASAAKDKTLNTHAVGGVSLQFSVLDPDRHIHAGPGSRHGCLTASHFLPRPPLKAADSSMPGFRGSHYLHPSFTPIAGSLVSIAVNPRQAMGLLTKISGV
jgi:hypothetical protein